MVDHQFSHLIIHLIAWCKCITFWGRNHIVCSVHLWDATQQHGTGNWKIPKEVQEAISRDIRRPTEANQ
jgi:hypothetical protein